MIMRAGMYPASYMNARTSNVRNQSVSNKKVGFQGAVSDLLSKEIMESKGFSGAIIDFFKAVGKNLNDSTFKKEITSKNYDSLARVEPSEVEPILNSLSWETQSNRPNSKLKFWGAGLEVANALKETNVPEELWPKYWGIKIIKSFGKFANEEIAQLPEKING